MEREFPPRIETVEDLAALGIAVEEAAAKRYQELADRMRRHGSDNIAALFERLATMERSHAHRVAEWAAGHGVEPGPVRALAERWLESLSLGEAAETAAGEAASEIDAAARDPYLATPYRALAFAVHNEERAFRLYSYIAAAAEDPRIRACAEELASEELGHAVLLRVERRRAYHAERNREDDHELPSPRRVETLGDLLAVAAVIESWIADSLATLVDEDPSLAGLAEARRAIATRLAEERATADVPAAAVEDAMAAWRAAVPEILPGGGGAADVADSLERLRVVAEQAFAFYDGVFAASGEEEVLLKAQALSRDALELIAALAKATGPAARTV